MRILFIGTDRNLFSKESVVSARHAALGKMFPSDTFTSIVFSTRSHGVLKMRELSNNVCAHATHSFSRVLYGLDAIRIARTVPRPDMVSAQDPFETGLVAYFLARYFKVPFVIEIHTDITSAAYKQHSLLNFFRIQLSKFLIPRASGIYAVSETVLAELIKKYSLTVPFQVLPLFVPVEKFIGLPRTPIEGRILWVGRFENEKNPLLAIDALKYAKDAGYAVHLTMLGEGSLRQQIESMITTREVSDSVELPGWNDPAEYLPNSELMLNTSSYEGYGMAIIEALAAGVPVLSKDVGVAREAGAVIAEGRYQEALTQWLSSNRKRGSLLLPVYANENEYIQKLHTFYFSLLS